MFRKGEFLSRTFTSASAANPNQRVKASLTFAFVLTLLVSTCAKAGVALIRGKLRCPALLPAIIHLGDPRAVGSDRIFPV